ncbi:ferrous iron transport protein A, partial [uncultured Desulfovibrio sp.]|uniref:FeoA family protein n=1 Tax=uncultured Desulfovibrio sp. TaxID=167968 RepID=UPI00350E3A64
MKMIFFFLDTRPALRQAFNAPRIFPETARNKGADMSELISLRQMKIGQHGKIARVEACGEVNQRIRDMGLIPGAKVSVVGRAPLKDPV